MKLAALIVLLAAKALAAAHDSEPFFKVLDRNSNGMIRAEEVENHPIHRRLDKDKDGAVSQEEFAAGWDALPALRTGLASLFPEAVGSSRPETHRAVVAESPRQGERVLPAAAHGIGKLVPDLSVATLDGQQRAVSALASGKPLVIANCSPSCPVSKRYLPTLLALEKQFPQFAFVYLATNKTDRDAALRESLSGRLIVRDFQGSLLRALGAKATTDCFVLDARRTLQYRGAVDDQYGLGYSLDAPRRHLLADALGAVSKGVVPGVTATEAPGCELDLSTALAPSTPGVTYHNRISRILQQHCQECHRSGGVAPFTLETFEQVTEHAGMIRKMVHGNLMPPWFASPPPPGRHSPWANDRSLPDRDREDLLAWLANGRPLGDEKDAPLPRKWPEGEWSIGTPDAVFQIPKPIVVKATGTMPYQVVRVPTNYTEDRYITDVEVLPTARDVVHHVLVFADDGSSGIQKVRRALLRKRELRGEGEEGETGGFFGIYVPGNNVLEYPEGFAKELPANSTLRFQIHYTPNGKATEDQVRIGLRFAKERPKHVVFNAGISNPRLSIPPGANEHPVEARLPVPKDAVVVAFLPHMHVRGKAWRYEAITPGGKPQVLLDVPRYDFNWQLLYRYAEPLRLPAGSVIKATGWYDNSTENPANPDPSKTVRWGPQTSDEMMLGYVEYYFPANTASATGAE